MNLHGHIMSLPQTPGLQMFDATEQHLTAYKCGHRDARHAAAELALKADAEIDELRKDAERYRWLRAQHWSTSSLCVVADPGDAVKLGRTCPSGEYLDIAVDDAMQASGAVG